jgi:hypothetical protein
VLAVDLNVRDTNGTLLFSQTLSDPSDLIDTIVGGNRYLWFNFLAVNKLAIDNAILQRNAPVTYSITSGSTFSLGTNTVTCTATDACGNSTNASFTVVVSKGQPSPPGLPVAPKLTVAVSSGFCAVTLTGTPGYNYVIEGSSDTVNWVPLQTNAAPFTFVDTGASGLSMRLYRAVSDP